MRRQRRAEKRHARPLPQRLLIANGFGISGGITYYEHKNDADMLIAAADGVQLENWTRALRTPVDVFKDEAGWQQDVSYLRSLVRRNKQALAYTKVGVPATREQRRNLRNYALGSSLLAIKPGLASFGFNDGSGEAGFAPVGSRVEHSSEPRREG